MERARAERWGKKVTCERNGEGKCRGKERGTQDAWQEGNERMNEDTEGLRCRDRCTYNLNLTMKTQSACLLAL